MTTLVRMVLIQILQVQVLQDQIPQVLLVRLIVAVHLHHPLLLPAQIQKQPLVRIKNQDQDQIMNLVLGR